MKTKFLSLLFLCIIILIAVGCKKKINPVLKNEGITSSYCGKITGVDPLDLRTIIYVQNGASSTEKTFIIDTSFLNNCENLKVLTKTITINVVNNGNNNDFNKEIFIDLIDSLGVQHDSVSVVIDGSFNSETLSMDINLIVNDVLYTLHFYGNNGDIASLIDGMYYGTFSIYGSDYPNDSIQLDWRRKQAVSVIAKTTLSTTQLDTDVETTVLKDEGFCTIKGEAVMDFKIDFIEFKDCPAVVIGTCKGKNFHLEVTLTPVGQQISFVLTFSGKRP